MTTVCDTLGIDIPDFKLQRRIHINSSLEIFGSRSNQRHSFITRVEVFDKMNHRYFNMDREPFMIERDMI
jgi:hypothetical protein